MTDAQKKFVELEKRKAEVKKYFEELEQATLEISKEIGINGMFQDAEGTVYKIVEPEGTFVRFQKIGYQRTRRTGEARGDLSMTEARERGFVVEGK